MPVTFDEKTCSFYCTGCMTNTPVRRRTFESPDKYVEFLEMVVLDHTECDQYQDMKKSEAARKFRKEVRRLMLVTARVM